MARLLTVWLLGVLALAWAPLCCCHVSVQLGGWLEERPGVVGAAASPADQRGGCHACACKERQRPATPPDEGSDDCGWHDLRFSEQAGRWTLAPPPCVGVLTSLAGSGAGARPVVRAAGVRPPAMGGGSTLLGLRCALIV